jgi:hypothetical protein
MSYRGLSPKPKITEAELAAIKDRCQKWDELQGWYDKARELQEEGETEITIPIEMLLLAQEIPKSVEKFWRDAIAMIRRAG